MIKDSDLTDARAIAANLEGGTATRRDLAAFLMYIRDHIPQDMVRDLAHFVAHSERDRGYAFKYTEDFVTHFVSVFTGGGILEVKPIYEWKILVTQLVRDAANIGIVLSEERLLTRRVQLEEVLSDLLNGVTLQVRRERIISCAFTVADAGGDSKLLLVIETDGGIQGVIKVPESVKIAIAVFD